MQYPTIDPRFDGLTLVGRGAMGSVYRAWDRQTSSVVALKVPASRMIERFWREARVLSTLHHPNIVRYIGHGTGRSGHAWLAMEWLEGEPLTARLARGPLSIDATLTVAKPIASALAWAHERRVVHRDLKPDNLFLKGGDLGRVKVLDFGLARPARALRALQSQDLTVTGVFMGTFEYMPPEQSIDAKRADARSDVFSLGAVLYHCLAGRPPRGDDESPSPSAPPLDTFRSDVPRPLSALVHGMLSLDRDARPPNAGSVLRTIEALEREWDAPTIQMRTSEIRDLSSPFGPSGTLVMVRPPGRARER